MGRGGNGRGRGGGGRGAARGGKGTFRPFSGLGQVLGEASSDDGQLSYYSRGFSGASRPGRGGSLSAKNHNAVPFDYSRLAHPSASSPSTLSSALGGEASTSAVTKIPIVPTAPRAPGQSPFAKGRYVREPEYPAYQTSRGNAMDGGSRPPEAQGDAKYLAAIPGRSSGGFGKARRAPRFGDPADRNPHLMPVAFVQASGEWKDGKWTGKDVSEDATDGVESAAVEGSQTRFDSINARPSGAGLGFASANQRSHVQTTLQDWTSQEEESSARDEDNDGVGQMAALLEAFPGSEELEGPGHLEFEQPRMEFLPDVQPSRTSSASLCRQADTKDESSASNFEVPATIASTESEKVVPPLPSNNLLFEHMQDVLTPENPNLSPHTGQVRADLPPRPATPSSEDDDEEMILVGGGAADTTRLTAQSDSEEDRQLDAIIAAASGAGVGETDRTSSVASTPPPEGFTLDFAGTSTGSAQSAPAPPMQTSSFVLGDEQDWEAELRKHGVVGRPASDNDSSPRLDPRVDFSQVMAESSDDDFVPLPGTIHNAKNKHAGEGRKARIAAKKARRKARKSGTLIAGDEDGRVDGVSASMRMQQKREPRMGDSDVEWGSDGPPDLSKTSRERRKSEKSRGDVSCSSAYGGGDETTSEVDIHRLSLNPARPHQPHQDLPRTRAEEERMLREALAISAAQPDGQGFSSASGGVEFSSISVRAPLNSRRGLKKRQTEQEALLADYMENALRRQPDSDDDVDEGVGHGEATTASDMDALLRFMRGMDGQQGGRQMTLGDIEDEQKMNEEDEWMTESGDDSEESDADEVGDDGKHTAARYKQQDGDIEFALDASERREIGESDATEDDTSSSDSDEDDKEEDDDDSASDQEDEDDAASDEEDGRTFDRNFSWAAEDEAFINNIERFARANDEVLRGSDRKARNKLFKAIEMGDFGDLERASAGDLADLLDEEDALASTRPAKRAGKGKGKQRWAEDALWADKLQKQWEKDRATKAANKRKRAEERRAAAQNPYPATHTKKGTKKMAKKAARAARRQAGGARTDDEAVDEWDPEESRGGGGIVGGPGQATNLRELDAQILAFLDDDGHNTMALAPMEKRSRAQVHMLADAYSIKSKSRGSGRHRFITLIKTKHSGVHVDTRKIAKIISGRGEASFGVTVKSGKKGKGSGTGKGGGQAGSFVATNKDGAEVGWGADKIGADNIGHRLLSMMGWSEGMGVGASGAGMADPVNATIKTSKGGLGF